MSEVKSDFVETKFVTLFEPPNELVLKSGEKLGPITVAYETYGTLNADKSNAIMIFHVCLLFLFFNVSWMRYHVSRPPVPMHRK